MGKDGHGSVSARSRLLTKVMIAFLFVALMVLVMDNGASSSSLFQDRPGSDVDFSTAAAQRLGSSRYHRAISQRRLLQSSDPSGSLTYGPPLDSDTATTVEASPPP